ncbi:putative oxidoreductase [Camellia lanceoleosa]|nr:putative oxidoreductase [Camellia lanceoleosa]
MMPSSMTPTLMLSMCCSPPASPAVGGDGGGEGKHVLLEKPVALNGGVDEILEACRLNGAVHGCYHVDAPPRTAAMREVLSDVERFGQLKTFGSPMVSERSVECEVPQEALMVREFANLVAAIMRKGSKPEEKWMVISRKTQLVLDAVKASIERGFEPVEVVSPLGE